MTLDDVSRCVTSLVERAQLPASLAAAPDDALAARHLTTQQQRAAPFPTHQVAKWHAVKQPGAADHSWRRIHSHGERAGEPFASQIHRCAAFAPRRARRCFACALRLMVV